MRPRTGLVALAVAAAMALLPAAAQATRPSNDDFQNSVITNDPGTPIPRETQLDWFIPGSSGDNAEDINEATVQGGEETTCTSTAGNPTAYGKTVWYESFPDISGYLSVTVSGGDAVLRMMPEAGGTPDFTQGACVDDPQDISNEDATFIVHGGTAYALQVGVYNNDTWPTQHHAKFIFYPDRDLDGGLDENDQCPTQSGPSRVGYCPDRDSDGVADKNDACPTTPAGAGGLNGCPNPDHDAVAGPADKCPNEDSRARDADKNGCLDYGRLGSDSPFSWRPVFRHGRLIGVSFTKLKVPVSRGEHIGLSCSPRSHCRSHLPAGASRAKSLRRRVVFVKLRTKVLVKLTKRRYVGRLITFTVKGRGNRASVTKKVKCIPGGGGRARPCRRVSTRR